MTEQIYNDFINKALPTIAQGAKITKEYATDLLGRYAQYQVVSNSLLAVLGLILLCLSYRIKKSGDEIWSKGDDGDARYALASVTAICGTVLIMVGIDTAFKCGFVPEICAIEAIQGR